MRSSILFYGTIILLSLVILGVSASDSTENDIEEGIVDWRDYDHDSSMILDDEISTTGSLVSPKRIPQIQYDAGLPIMLSIPFVLNAIDFGNPFIQRIFHSCGIIVFLYFYPIDLGYFPTFQCRNLLPRFKFERIKMRLSPSDPPKAKWAVIPLVWVTEVLMLAPDEKIKQFELPDRRIFIILFCIQFLEYIRFFGLFVRQNNI